MQGRRQTEAPKVKIGPKQMSGYHFAS